MGEEESSVHNYNVIMILLTKCVRMHESIEGNGTLWKCGPAKANNCSTSSLPIFV